MRTTLVAASLLTIALASAMPTASAASCPILVEGLEMQSSAVLADPCRELGPVAGVPGDAVGIVLLVVDTALEIYDQSDRDEDGVPDGLEPIVCGSDPLVIVLGITEPTIYCDGDNLIVPAVIRNVQDAAEDVRDEVEPTVQLAVDEGIGLVTLGVDTANLAIGIVMGAIDGADTDDDGVPNVLESTACFLENDNVDEDGTCPDDADYHPPQ